MQDGLSRLPLQEMGKIPVPALVSAYSGIVVLRKLSQNGLSPSRKR